MNRTRGQNCGGGIGSEKLGRGTKVRGTGKVSPGIAQPEVGGRAMCTREGVRLQGRLGAGGTQSKPKAREDQGHG